MSDFLRNANLYVMLFAFFVIGFVALLIKCRSDDDEEKLRMEILETKIRVWLVDDCDYIAALSLNDMLEFYCQQYDGAKVWAEVDLDIVLMHVGEPTDPDSEKITIGEAVRRHIREGGAFPTLICSTEF